MSETCQVLVTGGGSAGLAAAISAARIGADTILIERAGSLGGMGSLALVHTICGLFLVREEPEPVFANPGFAEEFARRLQASGGAGPVARMGRVDVLPHEPAAFAALAAEMAASTPNLRVWRQTALVAARRAGSTINSPLAEADVIRDGARQTITATSFIDTTGDAALTTQAGAAFAMTESARLQRPAYVFQLSNVPRKALGDAARLTLAARLVTAMRAGELPRTVLGAGFRAGVWPGHAYVTLDLSGDDGDGTTWDPFAPEALSHVERIGQRIAKELLEFLRNHAPGFERATLGAWPARPGVRESRRATGRYEMTGDDLRRGTPFDDGIALATWPMELRERATGPRFLFPDGPRPAQIPLRALRHRDVPNLWMAGRCLSATHEALASLRVMGTCFATGEAAGRAAARLSVAPPA